MDTVGRERFWVQVEKRVQPRQNYYERAFVRRALCSSSLEFLRATKAGLVKEGALVR